MPHTPPGDPRAAQGRGLLSMARRGDSPESPVSGRAPLGGRGGDGFRVGRMVADGDLRLVVLSLLADLPRHGYDIIKAIEELTSGSYSPSPGVIYPTLNYLEEAGHATASSQGNKKVYSISPMGTAYLAENRLAVDVILDHLDRIGRRIAQAREWFGRGEAALRDDRPDRDIPGVIPEMNDARRALKAAIASKISASSIEQHRVVEILMRAVAEIRADHPEDGIDI
ncbi:PadR family transcriptional regulator [Kaistia sp. UC242_56]|uniref:PadR family transcriptional regulator n=1 Tax=Kaistia sp. UC242_56 TaxID=3374625 RepID=UPI0037B83EE5